MLWALYAVLAGLFWAVSNIVDKHITEKHSTDPVFLTAVMRMFYLPALIALLLLIEIDFSASVVLWSVLAGASLFIAYITYFKAMSMDEVSRLIPLYAFGPMLIALLAVAFLGEVLSPQQYMGIALVVAGSLLLSIKRSLKFHSGKAFAIMMVSVAMAAVYSVIAKHVMSFTGYWSLFFWMTATLFVLSLIAMTQKTKALNKALSSGPRLFGLALFSSAFGFAGLLSFIFAVSLGPVSLVSPIVELQAFFVLLFATLTAVFIPGSITEHVTKKNVAKKLVAIAILFLGALLVAA